VRARIALLLLAFVALPVLAETYGPLSVVARPPFGKPQSGHYFEYRFIIENRSTEPHVVRLTVENSGERGNRARATRTFQIAPSSQNFVEVPQLITSYFSGDTVIVAIDGREQSKDLRISQLTAWEEEGGFLSVLTTRSVQMPREPNVEVVQPQIAPDEWSANWLRYGGYAAIVTTASDYAELPPPVHAAIERWMFAGGALVYVGTPEFGAFDQTRYGLGRMVVIANTDGFTGTNQPTFLQWRTRNSTILRGASEDVPLLEDSGLPMRVLFGGLVAFAIIGGPINVWYLAKKNRRVWIFWTLPLFALVSSVLLIGATIANEGWVRIHKSSSITYLDERIGRAATFGWSGFYATVSPRGEVRFDSATELRAIDTYIEDADTTWDDGQRLFGSWIGTRVPTYFAIRKSEMRRERLPLRYVNGRPTAVNGLGSFIEHISFANNQGVVYEAHNVAPGQSFALAPSPTLTHVRESRTYPPERMMHMDLWDVMLGAVEKDPGTVLVPNSYVAVLRDSPFLEHALERPTKSSHRGIVIGLVNREWGVEGEANAR